MTQHLANPAAPAEPVRSSASSVATPLRKPRDERLDVWRGLCLLDMLIVHLVHGGMTIPDWWHAWLAEYTRFAAGGFVAVSGLAVGLIFLPRAMKPERRWETYGRLWKRAGVILLIHWAATTTFLAAAVAREPMFDGWIWLRDVLLLRQGHDLLPFYVVMMLLAPAMLALLRRGLDVVLIGLSISFFAAVSIWPELNAWLRLPLTQVFDPALWQILFVAGLLAGKWLRTYDMLSIRFKAVLAGALWIASLVWGALGWGQDFGLLAEPVVAFWKMPLMWAEVTRYILLCGALFMTVEVLLATYRGRVTRALAAPAVLLGRNSLPVFVAHMAMVPAFVAIAEQNPQKDLSKLIWIPAITAAALVLAWAWESANRPGVLSRVRTGLTPVAAAASVVVLLMLPTSDGLPMDSAGLPVMHADLGGEAITESPDDSAAGIQATPLPETIDDVPVELIRPNEQVEDLPVEPGEVEPI